MSFGTKVKVLTVAYNFKKFPKLSSLPHLLLLSPMTPAILAFFLILREQVEICPCNLLLL